MEALKGHEDLSKKANRIVKYVLFNLGIPSHGLAIHSIELKNSLLIRY